MIRHLATLMLTGTLSLWTIGCNGNGGGEEAGGEPGSAPKQQEPGSGAKSSEPGSAPKSDSSEPGSGSY